MVDFDVFGGRCFPPNSPPLLINVNSNESLRETVEKYHISQRVVEKFMHLMEARATSEDPHVITEEAIGSYWNYIMAVSLAKED